jgi:hypothetical protein
MNSICRVPFIRMQDRPANKEVQYEAKTGNLRHAAFVGVRTDKSARDIRREGIADD